MSVEEKVIQAQKELEKRDNKGKFRKETWRERFGFWRIMWIFGWGAVAGVAWAYATMTAPDMFEAKTVVVINSVEAKTVEATQTPKTSAPAIKSVSEIANDIWGLESSRGVNNYSKCAAVGKVNGIGYGIPGNGSFMCFADHAEEMKVLEGWITEKRARGLSDKELLCLYSGSNYNLCK